MTEPSSSTTHYRCRPDVRFRIIDREAVILRQSSGENIVLNEVGSSILQWLHQGLSVRQISRRLPEEFEVQGHDSDTELHAFLEELAQAGVVEPVPPAESAEKG